jgi:hypothetical protein
LRSQQRSIILKDSKTLRIGEAETPLSRPLFHRVNFGLANGARSILSQVAVDVVAFAFMFGYRVLKRALCDT